MTITSNNRFGPLARRLILAAWALVAGGNAWGADAAVNVYRAANRLPAAVRRVAVLPLAVSGGSGEMDFGRENLQPVLLAELRKTCRFELIPVAIEDLKRWSGKGVWSAAEKLPADFLARIREATGADAVLFCQLSHYRPYAPVAIGWKLQLVDATQGNVLWAADIMFDAADPQVAASARCHGQAREGNLDRLLGASGILLSPNRFGQFAAATALGTLPAR
jgi:hypothetical protein